LYHCNTSTHDKALT